MAGNDEKSGLGRSRTILWCVPRSGSTALTKCLSFIDGIETWFEPYFYCRMISGIVERDLNLRLPPAYGGNEDSYRQAAQVFDKLCRCKSNPEHLSRVSLQRFLENSPRRHVFVKDMGFTMEKSDYKFTPEGYTHTFLVRHPIRVFASYRKALFKQCTALGMLSDEVAADEDKFDIERDFPFMDIPGLLFKDLYDVWKFAGEKSGSTPIVIDGDDLLSNPAEVLPKYCRAVGLPFSESLLRWDASTAGLNNWKLTADDLITNLIHAYERAVKSSEFLPPSPMPDRSHVTRDVIRCADKMMPYYNEMYNARI